MLDFKPFCHIVSMVQTESKQDEEMSEFLHKLYKKYLDLTPEQRQDLEEFWRDSITVPAHKLVSFYNASEKTITKKT